MSGQIDKETIIACLVKMCSQQKRQLDSDAGPAIRIPPEWIEKPPEVDSFEDPLTGEFVYRPR